MLLVLLAIAHAAPTLTIDGDCPGAMSIAVDGLPAYGRHVLAASGSVAPFTLGSGTCAGTALDLAPPFTLVASPTAGPDGSRVYTPWIDADLCPQSVQVVDLADCSVSAVVPFVTEDPVDPGDPPVSAAALRQWPTNDHVASSAPIGITWTGDSLLVSHAAGGGIFTFVTPDGDLIDSIDPVAHNDFRSPGDTAWLGDGFWANDQLSGEDWFIAPDGTLLEWRPMPAMADYRISYTWDGDVLWGASQDADLVSEVFSVDADGTVLSSFSSGYDLQGLTWDGAWLWGITWDTYELVRMSRDGSSITAIPISGLPGFPRGLAWDGAHFWTTRNTAGTDYVIEIEVAY